MLVKNFITLEQQAELLAWASSLPEFNEPNFAFIETISNVPLCLNLIRQNCLKIDGNKVYSKSIVSDFVLSVPVGISINTHVDGTTNCNFDGKIGNYKHTRFVVLLQKPTLGGELIVNNETILMDELDCFVLNTAFEHELSKVDGMKNYISIVFVFEFEF